MRLNAFTTRRSEHIAGTRSSAASGMESGTVDARRRRARRELATTVLVALALAFAAWLVEPVEASDAVVEDLHGLSTDRHTEATFDTTTSVGSVREGSRALIDSRSIDHALSTFEFVDGQFAFGADDAPSYGGEHPSSATVGLGQEATSRFPKCKNLLCCLSPKLCR